MLPGPLVSASTVWKFISNPGGATIGGEMMHATPSMLDGDHFARLAGKYFCVIYAISGTGGEILAAIAAVGQRAQSKIIRQNISARDMGIL